MQRLRWRRHFECLEGRHLLSADVVINEFLASNQGGQASAFFASPTPNAADGSISLPDGPTQVVINEIMYHPASKLDGDEYLELYNQGSSSVSLGGWRLSDGVAFTFPDYTLAAGETVVVAADVAQFRQTHGDMPNLVGGWSGRLSDSGETLELVNSGGARIDRLTYSDEGDWGQRVRGPLDHSHEGWTWSDAHDGLGASLELVNPALDNDIGQNWSPSLLNGGSPGSINGVATANAAPLINEVSHSPIIPTSQDSVAIRARVTDELLPRVAVTLYWRTDGAASFQATLMRDDGLSGDAVANDGIYIATVPPQTDGTVVEFFIQASDEVPHMRRYPNVALSAVAAPNLLYQVDNRFAHEQTQLEQGALAAQPTFRLIMTEVERAELAEIGAGRDADSNAQMNGTFIRFDGTDFDFRYNVGIRNRGKGSRNDPPNNYRVNFPNDQPWDHVTAINLNSKSPFTQVLGSALFQRVGVVAANATAVHVRVNGQDLSGGDPSMYGSYSYLEVLDGDFADLHFPRDPNGNVYSVRWGGSNQGDLRDEGSDPDAYRDRYFKETNSGEDDWSDLLRLIDVLNNAPFEQLLSQVEQIANVEQWLRFLALDTLLTNRETSPSNGIGDDYDLYRGVDDPRFVFIPHDMDSILGVTDGRTDYDIWLPAEMNGLSRLLAVPEVAQTYYQTLVNLIDDAFNVEVVGAVIQQLLGDWVPEPTRNQLLQFIEHRTADVLAQISRSLTVDSSLPMRNNLRVTDQATLSLQGFAPAAQTSWVEVNGVRATYDVQTAEWKLAAGNIHLLPGLNRLHVISHAADGQATAEVTIDIWRAANTSETLGGTLAADTVLTGDTTWIVDRDLVVPSGVSLRAEPGTLITLASGASIRIEGQVQALGTADQPIRLTRNGTSGTWDGLELINTQQSNELRFVDLAYADGSGHSVLVDHARLDMDHVRWLETLATSLEVSHPTLTVTNSLFPSVVDNETVHGSGLVGSERFILRDNTFGTTTGYSDIVDFTGGQRPGPILQVIGNTFLGGSDDGLDLDGTDAYIAGNLFKHIHKNNTSDSSSNAIATGVDSGNASELVIVGNIFYDVDHALLLKERSSAVFENNIVVQARESAINFDEPNRDVDPGSAIEILNSIFWRNEAVLQNFGSDPEFGEPDIRIDYSLLPESWHAFGVGNLFGDPGFVDFDSFQLRPDSPAWGRGSNGGNIGANGQLEATIAGEPRATTDATAATLHIAGPNVVSYRYRLANSGAGFGDAVSVDQPIVLTGLAAGSYAVEVIGIDSRGFSQSELMPTRSKTWLVTTTHPDIQINEVFANSGTTQTEGSSDDWIELYNPSSVDVDLTGMSLTDDLADPTRFVFASETWLPAGEYLLLPSSLADQSGLATGLNLSAQGDAVYLLRQGGSGIEVIDQVQFGWQIPGYSLGRRPSSDASWQLTKLTPNAENAIQPTGVATNLHINEWFTRGDVRLTADFVELANTDPLPVDLSGLHLSDATISWPDRHTIAPLSFIAGNGYTYLIADGDAETAANHLDFRLSSHTSQIGLFDRNLDAIDLIQYGPQQTDVAEGLTADGSHARFILPTPGLPNGISRQTLVRSDTLVSLDDTWHYDASGADLGADWSNADFDHTGWSAGTAPFGLESSPLAVPIRTALELGPTTYYFRTSFEFNVDADGIELELQTQLDDGAVFFLNGSEVLRLNMPAGNVGSRTFASTAVENAALSGAIKLPTDALVAGTNVLAVEVHQSTANSSDIVFAASLSVTTTQWIEPESTNDLNLMKNLRLTELMYHPEVSEDLEYIEFRNLGDVALNLKGVRLAGGVDFEFPESTLAAGDYIVVVNNSSVFQAAYGQRISIAGEYTGNLSNGGESLRLELPLPQSVAIHRFVYDDDPSLQWPVSADGDGYSLEIIDPNGSYSDPTNWRPSRQIGGDPGRGPLDGDVNGDANVDAADIDDLFAAIASENHDAAYDLDRNGFVQTHDADTLIQDILRTGAGDANLDRTVDFTDFLVLSANFGKVGGWAAGDFTGDGEIGFADFLLLAANFGAQPSQ